MPRFEPFRGVRYAADAALGEVTAPPYDVIDAADCAALAARAPHNVVRIDCPPPPDGYRGARETLDAWLADGVLVRDRQPAFYGYRMSYRDDREAHRHTTGVLGALELSRPGEGSILPHEYTTPKARTDRLELLRALRTNSSAVWALSPASGLTTLVGPDPATGDAVTSWTDGEVDHALWPIVDTARVAEIAARISHHPVVIADGHHRYETSLAYRDEQPDGANPGARALLTYVVELVDEELSVQPIHRLINGLAPDVDLPGAFERWFSVEPVAGADLAATMASAAGLVLVTPDGRWQLAPRPELLAGARDLDSSRLERALTDLPAHELTYQHGIDEVVARVGDGRAQAGVLLRPATVDQIVKVANGGERMPPKTTFFWPKPATGAVLRLLDE